MAKALECIGCLDNESETIMTRLPCGQHAVCDDCLRDMVRYAIAEESHYPLGCGSSTCPEISIDLVQKVLGSTSDAVLLHRLEEKVQEYAVPPSQRTYCASRECCSAQGESRFLDAGMLSEGTRLICPDCSCVTCSVCKYLRDGDTPHDCSTDDHDQVVKVFLQSVPTDDRWLWQKCFQCGSWIEKSAACNHMSCRCSAEFCLVCGRRWEGLVSCRWGCPKYGCAVYDEDGFNQNGFNPETGLDRLGNPWDPLYEHGRDGDGGRRFDMFGFDEDGFDVDGYDANGYDANGYDEDGFDEDGFDVDGYDEDGFDRQGLDRDGYDDDGYDEDGFDVGCIDRDGYDQEGLDEDGFDRDGYDEEGFDKDGFDEDELDKDGFDREGFNEDGFDREGVSKQKFSREYYDEEGYDPFGFDVWGFSPAGLDYEGRDRGGYDIDGYDTSGHDVNGHDRKGRVRSM